jgi:tetratricopeptide (TPR) repeat protein
MATTKSRNPGSVRNYRPRRAPTVCLTGLLGCLLLACGGHVSGAGPSGTQSGFREEAQQAWQEARRQHRQNPADNQLAWEFARACFEWADHANEDSQRERIAEQGIHACRAALERDAGLAPAHYYLALNLGQVARTKTVGALRIVSDMERALHRVIALDETFDHAGAHRSLGILYAEAPGWPVSVGSRSRSKEHFQRAVHLSPDYPGNRMAWLEAAVKWKDNETIQTHYPALKKLLPRAREEFSGRRWAPSWAEWDERWKLLREQIEPDRAPED